MSIVPLKTRNKTLEFPDQLILHIMAKKASHSIFQTLIFILFLGSGLFSRVAGKVPAVIVFGDSSVDTGNNNGITTMLKSNFAPYGKDFEGGRPTGRFSNGRVPPDFISERFGLKKTLPAYLDPKYGIQDFATGVVFASAGTGYDNVTASVLNVIPFWKEIEMYKEYQKRLKEYQGEQNATNTISEAMYIVSIGTNDFLENYYLLPSTRDKFTVQQFEDHLVRIAGEFILDIYNLGARKISLGGLPPMGCLPLERATNIFALSECNEEYNNVALEYNVKLGNLVSQLNKDLHGLELVFANPYFILLHMIRKPSLYGFEVTWKACCGTGFLEMSYLCEIDSMLTCSDASKYVFWDSFHPTEKTNRIAADYVFNKFLFKFM